MNTPPIRTPGVAAIYARVSTDRQARGDRTSLNRQVKNARRCGERLGLTVPALEQEHGRGWYVIRDAHSASDPDDRAELDSLLAAARRQEFRYVIMDVIDRTTRAGGFDFVDICQQLLDADVEPIWASHPEWDMTDAHDQHEALKEAIKAYEDKETIARRFQEGKTERIENGDLIRCFIDYGYRWNAPRPRYRGDYVDDDDDDDQPEDPRTGWEPDDGPDHDDTTRDTADVVRRIFTYLANGWRLNTDASAIKLRDHLNAEHVPTPSMMKGSRRRSAYWKGKPAKWQAATITKIVRNATYKGERHQRRWKEEPRDRKERKAKGLKTTTRVVERDRSEWVSVRVPPLVDEATWGDAQKQLDRNTTRNHREPRRYSTADALLYGGCVHCAHCRRVVSVAQRSESAVRHPTNRRNWSYMCTRQADDVREGGRCRGVQRLASEVDALVWHEVTRIIRDPAYLRARLVQTDEAWSPEDEAAHYQRLIATCDDAERLNNRKLLALGDTTDLESLVSDIRAEAKRIAADRAKYVQSRDLARAEMERRTAREQRVQEFIQRAQEQAETLDDLTPDQRRQTLMDFHPEVYLGRSDQTLYPRIAVFFNISRDVWPHLHAEDQWMQEQRTIDGESFYSSIEPQDPPTMERLAELLRKAAEEGEITLPASGVVDFGGGLVVDLRSTTPPPGAEPNMQHPNTSTRPR